MKNVLIGLLLVTSASVFAESRIERFSGDNMLVTSKNGCQVTLTQTREYNSSKFKLSLTKKQCANLKVGDTIKEVVVASNGNGIHTAIEISKLKVDSQSGLSIVSILKD